MKNIILVVSILGILLTGGCSALTNRGSNTINNVPIVNTPSLEDSENFEEVPPNIPVNLMVWVPQQFSTDDSEAGFLLQNQLNVFMEIHPTVRIDIRIKEEMGSNGLLNSVYLASLAAPVSLPDLIAMPSQELNEAISLDLIIPFSQDIAISTDEQFFDFAREFSFISDNLYGLPFASELLIFAYRPLANPTPPTTWEEMLQSIGPIAFPGADAQSLIPILFYQSQGGSILNDEQIIEFDPSILKSVFELLEEGSVSNLFPFWLTQYQTDSQAWQAISENRAQASITWSNNYFLAKNQSIKQSAIPTKLGTPFTYGKGWMWSIVNKDTEKQEIIEELAQFLSNPSFLAEWTISTGYYPTSGNVLELWPNNANSDLGWQILPTAKSIPSEELLNTIGGTLQIVVEKLLKQEIKFDEATNTAISTLIP